MDRFQDASGETHEVRSNVASAASSVKIGDRVPVLYNPRRPNEATIATVGNTWGGTLIGGAIFAAMGILSLRVGRLALYYSNKIREAMLAQASRTPLSQPEVS